MKKTLATIIFTMLVVASAFGWDPHHETSLVQATSDAKRGLWFSANQSAELTVNLKLSNQNVKFGYFTFASDANLKNQNFATSDKVYFDFVDNSASFSVKAGESVGYFMEVDGTTYNSIRSKNEPSNKGFYFTGEGTNNEGRTFVFYDNTKTAQLKMTFDVAPSGQPLPGAIVSLAVIASLLGGIKVIRAKRLAK